MTTSISHGIKRHKFAAAVLGIAATAAIAVPGVAWAQTGVPNGSPVSVEGVATELQVGQVGCEPNQLPDEDLKNLNVEGVRADPSAQDSSSGLVIIDAFPDASALAGTDGEARLGVIDGFAPVAPVRAC